MYGGPSHVDTFDYKPDLYPLDGKTIAVKTFGRGGKKNEGRIVGPKWSFRQYGESGKWVSELFPNLATCVDDIAFIHSMYAESPIHGSAMLMMNSGRLLRATPAWARGSTMGWGVKTKICRASWSCSTRPAARSAARRTGRAATCRPRFRRRCCDPTACRSTTWPRPPGIERTSRRLLLDRLRAKNEDHLATRADNSELAARIASYELAFKMQQSAPEAVDFARESADTLSLYGIDRPRTADFGRKCLIARRMVERGVRFVQIYSGGAHNDDNWDAHADLVQNHTKHAGNTDKPIAGLLKDLKRGGSWTRPWSSGVVSSAASPPPKTPGAPGAIITLMASRCGWPAAESREEPASARPTTWEATPSKTASTSRTCTRRSCSSSASTPTAFLTSTAGYTKSWWASKGPSQSARSSDLI